MSGFEKDLYWIVPLLIIDLLLKGVALWKAAKNNQISWFTFLLLINSAGVLPIIYLKFFQKRRD